MAFQFKTRTRENAHEECEKEMGLLKEYTRALEKENESRNEERKALQAEIERLLRHQREWKQGSNGGISTGQSLLIVGEQSQLRQQYSELKSKYQALILENSSLTSRIITQDYSSRPASFDAERTRLTQTIRTLEGKVSLLETKLAASEREVTQSRIRQENSSSSLSRQYQQATTKIDELERQLRAKNESMSRLEGQLTTKEAELVAKERELAAKEEQRVTLQRSVDGYSLKIDALSDQLARLERVHKVETIRVVEREDPLLRTKIDQLSSLNAALTADNIALRGQAEYTRELERRASLLEQRNQQLQVQLRTAIEARNSASRVQVQEDRGLRESVLSLRSELQEVRSFNQLVRQENEELHAQLQMLKGNSTTHSKCNRCRHRHKSRSRSPIRPEPRPVRTEAYSTMQTSLSHQGRTYPSHYHSNVHSQARLMPQVSEVGERYNQLQRKIQLLQSENQVLKQHLVHEV